MLRQFAGEWRKIKVHMKIVYISGNSMFLCSDGKISELPCERAEKYTDTVNEINKNKEWKHSGAGAMFREDNEHYVDASKFVRINGVSASEEGFIYSAVLGEMGAIYRKSADSPKAPEGHIYTGMNRDIGDIAYKNGKIAAILDGHLAVFDERGDYNEITDGHSAEDTPFWSVTDGRIFCSTKGRALEGGNIYSASSILAVDEDAGSIDTLFAEEGNDLLSPKNDADGNYYFIRQPYKMAKSEKEPVWKSILLFPVRLVKALFGFVNAFSVLFGGEPLRKSHRKGDVKSRTKSPREQYFEERLREAEKNEKENAAAGDKNPGIFPRSRVLVRISPDETETVLCKGVLDYTLCDEGVICSNGKELLLIGKDGNEKVIAKAELAEKLSVINE